MNVLVIIAHPDDPEFFAGGTIARWRHDGHDVRYVVVTGGDKGSDQPDMTPARLAAIRRDEQCRAAAVLGVHDVTFLGHVDGELLNARDVRRDLAREIRRARPDVVLTTDPQTLHYGATRINHTDHRAVGLAVCDAIFPAAGNRMYFPELLAEGFEPHTPKEIYFAGPACPNTLVDVTDFIQTKIAAIRMHASQVKAPDELESRIRQGLLRITADGRVFFAEAFRRIWL
ncbi:MAG: GlcNAc-PI de-N-acetylase [Candidatus Roseilinea sp.]|nr:MAG: GlcNAc-PI de-N-acetylase [Candidatus Roseilinea sp.]